MPLQGLSSTGSTDSIGIVESLCWKQYEDEFRVTPSQVEGNVLHNLIYYPSTHCYELGLINCGVEHNTIISCG